MEHIVFNMFFISSFPTFVKTYVLILPQQNLFKSFTGLSPIILRAVVNAV